MNSERQHAVLSASSSDRWIHCSPSVRLSEGFKDKESDYALEGTCAHALAEYKLRKALGYPAQDPTEALAFSTTRRWRKQQTAMSATYWKRSRPQKRPALIRLFWSNSAWTTPAG